MKWILIVIILNLQTEKDSPKITMQEFSSKGVCYEAMKIIETINKPSQPISIYCIPE